MTRRHMQVERLAYHGHRLDHDRLRVDQLRRRRIADVNTTIETGLADTDRDTDVGGECRNGCQCHGGCGGRKYEALHINNPYLLTVVNIKRVSCSIR